jgi:hypothetical protein
MKNAHIKSLTKAKGGRGPALKTDGPVYSAISNTKPATIGWILDGVVGKLLPKFTPQP